MCPGTIDPEKIARCKLLCHSLQEWYIQLHTLHRVFVEEVDDRTGAFPIDHAFDEELILIDGGRVVAVVR